MSYTGIKEIDDLLLDLYDEQASLERKLKKNNNDKKLVERHRKIISLQDALLKIGLLFEAIDVSETLGRLPLA